MKTAYLDRRWVIDNGKPWEGFATAFRPPGRGSVAAAGTLRAAAEDFLVEEDLGFAPDGDGEHELLQIRKSNLNTLDVARVLARCAGLPVRDIGYCGLKDRRAVATQWFSAHVPAGTDWTSCNSDRMRILATHRHRRKLRRGTHRGNRFRIIVRDLTVEREMLVQSLSMLRRRGAPNYYGEQRFGRNARNLANADAMFAGAMTVRDRHVRGLYISAARSWLFNCVLSERVKNGTWLQLLPGDVASLDGSGSFFAVTEPDPELKRRLEAGDIHPSGPLWGAGEPPTQAGARELEETVLEDFAPWKQALIRLGMRHERRALRMIVGELDWELNAQQLVLSFELKRGGFATSVLRECIDYFSAH